MIVKHQYLKDNQWISSIADDIPHWFMSSTSKYKDNRYIYMTKSLCKECHAKKKCLSNK